MTSFILPLVIFIAITMLSLWALSKFKIGRLLVKSAMVLFCVPIVYLLMESIFFYSCGRSIYPTVGIVIGMFCPPNTYSHLLLKMDICNGISKYEGEFTCRHFGKYGIALCLDRSMLKVQQQMATLKCGLSYEVIDCDGNVCASGIVDSQYSNYVNAHSPYVIVGRFNVPKDLIRNKKYVLRVFVNIKDIEIIDGFSSTSITVIKMSDA